jgi:hypothetical protein
MLLPGVEEELGVFGRVDECACSDEVLFGEELVALLAVHLDGDARRPCLSELGDGEARGHEQRTARAGSRLRESLRDHDAERDACVDDVGAKLLGGGDAAFAQHLEAGLAREGHAVVQGGERPPVEEVRRVHGVTGSTQLLGEGAHSVGQTLDVVEQDDFAHPRPSSAIDPLSWNILGC